jgi:hypothetical protein
MKDDTIQAISKALGLIIIYVVGIGIKAWLLSWCVSFFFPMVLLPFWKWYVVVFTIDCLKYQQNHD